LYTLYKIRIRDLSVFSLYKCRAVWYFESAKNVFVFLSSSFYPLNAAKEPAVKKENLVRCVLRLLCALIDYLLLMLPVQLIMMYGIGVPVRSVDFLFRLLFAVYGTLMAEYNSGATVGKMFGRMMVVDSTGGKPPILYVGLRELVKSMYLIPYIGWACGAVSVVLLAAKGTTLHDMAGRTRVILQREQRPPEEDA